MIQIETRDGPVHVPLARIVSITHAGTSSQWHGTRAIVKVDGKRWPIESTEDAQTIASRCDAALRSGAMAKTMLFNPYTGKPRNPRDIQSDPEGILMLDPDEPMRSVPAAELRKSCPLAAQPQAEPVAWLTEESWRRMRAGGNQSRGTVPVHVQASRAAYIPLYAAQPQPAASKWLGPHTDGAQALDALRRACADIIGADPETWPDHGNAPLAIAAALGLRQAALSKPAAQPVPAWIACSEEMPQSGQKVLACYRNRNDMHRTILAEWIAAKSKEGDEEHGDLDLIYDDAADCYYWPEGWYEVMDNWPEYSHLVVSEGTITHWQPLPTPPDAPR